LDCPIFLIPELGTGSERYLSLVKNLKTKQSVFSFNKQFYFNYETENYFIINTDLIEKLAKSLANHIINSEISQKIILAGYSLAGSIAVEISFELKKYNIEVAQIHLLDSYKFGNTVYTNLSELRFKFGYFKRIITLLGSGIINRNKTKFNQLLYFIQNNEINSKEIKNIPVYLYKCLAIPSIKFIHPESLDWNNKIEHLKIIDINSKHDNMMKEGNVEELAAKMDESIDSLLNELNFQIKQFESLSKSELDYYLSKGWFRLRFGNHMFTDTKAPFDNKYFPIKWLRYKLDESFLRKSIKSNNRYNQCKKFKSMLLDFNYENEKDEIEPLYTKYRSNVNFDAYTSVYSAVHHADAASSIFNTKIIKLYDYDKLIGVGLFNVGEISGSGVLYYFDHEYRRYGIGKYLILLELEYLFAHHYRFHYPGFIFIGHPKLDYKLSVEKSGIEYYDPEIDQWLSYYN
jgi:thioesterase domain-containing protein